MKYFINILDDEFKPMIKNEERIYVAEHALDRAPRLNKYFFEVIKAGESAEVMKDHVRYNKDLIVKKSLEDVIDVLLSNYENRTIHVEKENIDYTGLVKMLKSYEDMDFVASYKHFLFEPLSMGMWQKHSIDVDERMVFYALDFKHKNKKSRHKMQSEVLRKVPNYFGRMVSDKRKTYNQYASHTYKVDYKDGLHAKPASKVINLTKKYPGDIWARTDSKELDIKGSIVSLLSLGIPQGQNLTILYKPAPKSKDFYDNLEALEIDSKNLFVKVK